MLTETPSRLYLDDLVSVACGVFQTMLRLSAEPVDAPLDTPPEMAAAVRFMGQWNGALAILCSRRQAALFARRLINTDDPAPDEIEDALAELANMVGGNMKSILPRGVQLTMPAVSYHGNYAASLDGEALTTKLVIETEAGRVLIVLMEITSPA
jgi:chemotaxis protein CheX